MLHIYLAIPSLQSRTVGNDLLNVVSIGYDVNLPKVSIITCNGNKGLMYKITLFKVYFAII